MSQPIKCLIVDDDSDDREIFLMMVDTLGKNIECRTSVNGADAIDLFEKNRDYKPQFIFLDINMPKVNGIDCLKSLRSFDRLSDTRIYMYSTSADEKIHEKATALGASGFIVKPTDPNELKNKLSHIFAN